MFRHVKQKADWDCSIACMAMWTGRPYSTILYHTQDILCGTPSRGLTTWEIKRVMKSFGVETKVLRGPWAGVTGILDVPSLNSNRVNDRHAVYWSGWNIYDPNFKVKGKKFYEKDACPPINSYLMVQK